jgi:hypothetical protein
MSQGTDGVASTSSSTASVSRSARRTDRACSLASLSAASPSRARERCGQASVSGPSRRTSSRHHGSSQESVALGAQARLAPMAKRARSTAKSTGRQARGSEMTSGRPQRCQTASRTSRVPSGQAWSQRHGGACGTISAGAHRVRMLRARVRRRSRRGGSSARPPVATMRTSARLVGGFHPLSAHGRGVTTAPSARF